VKPLSECTVAVVGLGLMGGSLAGALRGSCRAVLGVARRPGTAARAERLRLVDQGTTDETLALPQADAVILATPVRTIIRQLDRIPPLLRRGCLVMDLGSTKAQIAAAMAQLPPHVHPLGGHPMCGKETSGIEAADPTLYRNRTFILTPLDRTPDEAVTLGRSIVAAAGARPLILDPIRQDRLAATLSHLPYLLACALVLTADATTSKDPAAWEIVASGFRDTTRVAGSNVTMMLDILLTNREAVLEAASTFRTVFDELIGLTSDASEAPLRASLKASRKERRRMFP